MARVGTGEGAYRPFFYRLNVTLYDPRVNTLAPALVATGDPTATLPSAFPLTNR